MAMRQRRRVPVVGATFSLGFCAAVGALSTGFCGLGRLLPSRGNRPKTSLAYERTSQYEGVSWHNKYRMWIAQVPSPHDEDDSLVNLGPYQAERDAAQAFDLASLSKRDVSTNFPREHYTRTGIREAEIELANYWIPRPSMRFQGVFQVKASNKWKAEVDLFGVKQFIDDFDTEEEAAQAYDEAIRDSNVFRAVRLEMLNFIRDDDYFDMATYEDEPFHDSWSSKFMGVTFHSGRDRWLVKIGRKHHGLFDTELEAAFAFDAASAARGGLTNFKQEDDGIDKVAWAGKEALKGHSDEEYRQMLKEIEENIDWEWSEEVKKVMRRKEKFIKELMGEAPALEAPDARV